MFDVSVSGTLSIMISSSSLGSFYTEQVKHNHGYLGYTCTNNQLHSELQEQLHTPLTDQSALYNSTMQRVQHTQTCHVQVHLCRRCDSKSCSKPQLCKLVDHSKNGVRMIHHPQVGGEWDRLDFFPEKGKRRTHQRGKWWQTDLCSRPCESLQLVHNLLCFRLAPGKHDLPPPKKKKKNWRRMTMSKKRARIETTMTEPSTFYYKQGKTVPEI